MEEKTDLKVVLCILGVLAVGAAIWRVLAYEPGHVGRTSSTAAVQTAPRSGQVPPQEVQRQELLDEFFVDSARQTDVSVPVPTDERTEVPPSGKWSSYPQNQTVRQQSYSGRLPDVGGKRYVNTHFYTQGNQVPSTSTAPQGTAYTGGAYVGPQANFTSSAYNRVQEERARMLAPYLRPNRKEKEEMDVRLAKLSAAIERAVAQALMPKSKRQQNIEKYATSNNMAEVQSSGLAGSYAPVGNVVATQKREIVKSFGAAFGSQAAAQADSLMDSYAQELAGALNMPNLTPEQKEQKVKEISKKYQKEMNKLAEKNQYDKFVADRVAQDNKQKAELQARYPNPELNAKFSQIIDDARAKDLALATQQLSAQEYYKAVYANQYEAHTKLEDAVRQAGESLSALQEWDNQNAQKEIDTLRQQEEEGKIISAALKSSQEKVEGMADTLQEERNKILAPISQTFGEQKAQEVEQILDNYRDKMLESMQQELSPAERAQRQHDLRVDSNRKIVQWWMDQVQEMNIPQEQKQAELEKLRQDYNHIK